MWMVIITATYPYLGMLALAHLYQSCSMILALLRSSRSLLDAATIIVGFTPCLKDSEGKCSASPFLLLHILNWKWKLENPHVNSSKGPFQFGVLLDLWFPTTETYSLGKQWNVNVRECKSECRLLFKGDKCKISHAGLQEKRLFLYVQT